jgi:hypothetical protein
MNNTDVIDEIYRLIPLTERPKLLKALHQFPDLLPVVCELYQLKREAKLHPEERNLFTEIADLEQKMLIGTL